MPFESLQKKVLQGSDIGAVLRASAAEICEVFGADRITIYRVIDNGATLSALVQTGLESYDPVKVSLHGKRSVAGQVGALKKAVNITNAYDDDELAPLELQRKMFVAVDERTGYRTTQVLAAPIVSTGGRLLGVVELLNRVDNERFPDSCTDELEALCAILAPAFSLLAKQHSPA
jgi:GAF domain-containing protein